MRNSLTSVGSKGSSGSRFAERASDDNGLRSSAKVRRSIKPSTMSASQRKTTLTKTAVKEMKAKREREEQAVTMGHQVSMFESTSSQFINSSYAAASTVPAVTKLNAGLFDRLTLYDVKELFAMIDTDQNDRLDFQEVKNLLTTVLHPPCMETELQIIYGVTDRNEDGCVSVEELHRALTNGVVREHLSQLQRRAKLSMTNGDACKVSKKLFLDRVYRRVEMEDSFKSLPFSTTYLILFIALVLVHLRIDARFLVEDALDDWISGYGDTLSGPFLETIADTNGMFDWMETSGLKSFLGDCRYVQREDSRETVGPFCYMAARSILIGDVQLRQRREDGSEESVWLLHTDLAQQHLAATPGDFFGAALGGVRHLRNSGWVDDSTDNVDIILSTYSNRAEMFAKTEVRFKFGIHGAFDPTILAVAVFNNPYKNKGLFAVDGLFCLMILIPLCTELKDLVTGMHMSGCRDGCVAYWNIWNAVDWVSIFMGLIIIVVWVLCCIAMGSEELQALLEDGSDDRKFLAPTMDLNVQALNAIEDDLRAVIWLFRVLHFLMVVNTVSIMLKFFKSFRANKKLQLMTDTLIKAFPDIFHFTLVFVIVFLAFSLTGHILFGGDLIEFNTLGGSMNTAFTCLMGDFGWYVDRSNASQSARSEMPHFLMAIWFFFFMVLVLLIMLNMLLAIILEHYTACCEHVKSFQSKAIWEQGWDFIKSSLLTRGFIPLLYILLQMEDPDQPIHPENLVTDESLTKHFPSMKPQQVAFLMEWLEKEAENEMIVDHDEMGERLIKVEKFLESMCESMHIVSLRVGRLGDQITRLQSRMDEEQNNNSAKLAAPPPESPHEAVLKELSSSLSSQLAKQENATQELCKVTEVMVGLASPGKHSQKSMSNGAAFAPPPPRELPPCHSACNGP